MSRLFLLLIFIIAAPSGFALDYERFEQDGKVGLRDQQGRIVLPAAFDALGWSDGSFSVVGEITGYRKAGQWGLLHLKKEFITKAEYISLLSAGGNYVRATRTINAITTKTGCLNLTGEVVIPFVYDDLVVHDLHAIVMIKEQARYRFGLVDLSHRTILPVVYQSIRPLGSLRYAVRNFDNKTALCTEDGTWITGFDIDSLSSFHADAAILYQGVYRGLIDRMGMIRAQPVYRDVAFESGGYIKLRKPDTWKILDVRQRELHRVEADALAPVGPNRYVRTLNGKSGLVDSLLQEVVPTRYDFIGTVSEEMFVVGNSGKYGLMRTTGEHILPLAFDTLIRDGHLLRARLTESGKAGWHLYDTVGVRKTTRAYDVMDAEQNGLYPVSLQGYAGAVDRLGRERIACVYDSLLAFSADRVAVKFKGLYGIISRDDVWQLTPQSKPVQLVGERDYLLQTGTLRLVKDYAGNIIYFTDNPVEINADHFLEQLPDGSTKEVSFGGQLVRYRVRVSGTPAAQETVESAEGLTVVYRDGKFGFVDERGRLRIANRYEDARNFREGLAPVRLLGKWGFADKDDQVVIHPVYDQPAHFHNGLAIVARGGKYGIIDREGRQRLDLRYDSLQRVDAHTYLFFLAGQCGLADGEGRILLEPRFEQIQPADSDRVIVQQGGRYGLLSREGLSVFPVNYQVLRFNPATQTYFANEPGSWESLSFIK